jgi:uncharacterized protein YuzE
LKLRYDPEVDVLYFHFKDGPAEIVKEIEDEVVAELDKKGEVMGIEVWGVKKRGVLRQLTQLAANR